MASYAIKDTVPVLYWYEELSPRRNGATTLGCEPEGGTEPNFTPPGFQTEFVTSGSGWEKQFRKEKKTGRFKRIRKKKPGKNCGRPQKEDLLPGRLGGNGGEAGCTGEGLLQPQARKPVHTRAQVT